MSEPTQPVITGIITSPHTIRLDPSGQVVVTGERIQPETPGYNASVPVTAVEEAGGSVWVTTGSTFLPLENLHKMTTFKVVSVP